MTKLRAKPVLKPSIEKAARKLLEEKLGRHGLKRIEITAAPDHDGEPSLYFEVHFGLLKEPFDPSKMPSVQPALAELLFCHGEERFGYLRYKFDERQKVVGDA